MKKTTFVPMLAINKGIMELDFYKKGFNAKELRRWSNDDGSIHVAEMEIDGAMFHLQEERSGVFPPDKYNGVTATIGLMVQDVDSIMAAAITAGATENSPAQDFDYGYRQGVIIDPFGHKWLIEQKI